MHRDSPKVQALLLLLAHMRLRWYLYLPVFGIWAIAYLRLFADRTYTFGTLASACDAVWLASAGRPCAT